ncbi:MAG: L-threonylcarbamoyladenylate synthase [Deltaproteobacteria bacterium]|nr:L-threonylcarbamoyladenylate synthase [Deltaproteobacteria bacterium]
MTLSPSPFNMTESPPPIFSLPFSDADQELIARFWRTGEVMVFPTETAYGLGGNGFHPGLAERVYRMKGRAEDKPLPLLIHGPSMLGLAARNIHPGAEHLMERFWPGPLTLVLHAAPGLPPHLANPQATVALRWSPNREVSQLLAIGGTPLTATSANLSGHPPRYRLEDVLKDFPAGLALAVRGDEGRSPQPPSTLVDTTTTPFRVLRQGRITVARLRSVLLEDFPDQAPLEGNGLCD